MSKSRTNRRDFIKIAATGAAAFGLSFKGISLEGKELDGLFGANSPRLKGQESVMDLACEPLETVRIGYIGLGMRGMGAVARMLNVEGIEIRAVCDIVPGRVKQAQKIISSKVKLVSRIMKIDKTHKAKARPRRNDRRL